MKCYKKSVYTIELTEEEARWLKNIVQNPIRCNVCGTMNESEEDSKMREKFWTELGDVNGREENY